MAKKGKVSNPAQGSGDALSENPAVQGDVFTAVETPIQTGENLNEAPEVVVSDPENQQSTETQAGDASSDGEANSETQNGETLGAESNPLQEENETETQAGDAYLVLSEFRDANNFDKVHTKGSILFGLEDNRLKHLLSIGYIEKVV